MISISSFSLTNEFDLFLAIKTARLSQAIRVNFSQPDVSCVSDCEPRTTTKHESNKRTIWRIIQFSNRLQCKLFCYFLWKEIQAQLNNIEKTNQRENERLIAVWNVCVCVCVCLWVRNEKTPSRSISVKLSWIDHLLFIHTEFEWVSEWVSKREREV
jgi:hypothetical protein